MNQVILIVDDNPINLKLVTEVLGYEGYGILQAVSAEQAQALLVQVLPDLILMDIGLPGMDGLTLTHKLKGDPRTQSIPVVALTAAAMKGDEEKAVAAGCNGYLTKPVNTRTLATQITGWLRPSTEGSEADRPYPKNDR
jgi:CheY-like chemotaxis protein